MVTEKMIEALKPCPNCGGKERSWFPANKINTTAQDGRLKSNEVSCDFVLGCDECSETLRVVSADEIASRMTTALSTDAEPVAWVSPVDLQAWQRAKAGEIWAWPENLEGQCVPLYAKPVKPDFFEVEEVREQKLATVAAPDNGTTAEVLAAVLECAEAWVPEARIIGNVRAGDIARVVRSALSAQVQDVDDRAAINLGASVLSKIADPAAREVAIRNALTAALNRDTQAQEVEILAGWQLVPKEPTSEMTLAGQTWRNAKSLFDRNDAFHVYRAMLAAAPAAKLEEKP